MKAGTKEALVKLKDFQHGWAGGTMVTDSQISSMGMLWMMVCLGSAGTQVAPYY